MSDIKAYESTSLKGKVESLPNLHYIIGDNAYVPSEHLLVPFSGSQRQNPANDAYNFYLSQLRIRIEMAFGLMTSKWRILRKPLEVDLKNARKVIVSICRLHNYVITRNQSVLDRFSKTTNNINEDGEDVDSGMGFTPSDTTVQTIKGASIIRDKIVKQINDLALTRPAYNMRRNAGN